MRVNWGPHLLRSGRPPEQLHGTPTSQRYVPLRTPLGLRRQPPVLPTINLREGSFSDSYEGGWQELLPVAGDVVRNHLQSGARTSLVSPPMLGWAIEQRRTLKLDPAAELSTELEASILQAGK